MRARLLFVLVFLALAWGISGCFHSRELALMKRDFVSQAPGLGLNHQFTISLGSFSIGFARLVTRLIPEEEVHRAGREAVRSGGGHLQLRSRRELFLEDPLLEVVFGVVQHRQVHGSVLPDLHRHHVPERQRPHPHRVVPLMHRLAEELR